MGIRPSSNSKDVSTSWDYRFGERIRIKSDSVADERTSLTPIPILPCTPHLDCYACSTLCSFILVLGSASCATMMRMNGIKTFPSRPALEGSLQVGYAEELTRSLGHQSQYHIVVMDEPALTAFRRRPHSSTLCHRLPPHCFVILPHYCSNRTSGLFTEEVEEVIKARYRHCYASPHLQLIALYAFPWGLISNTITCVLAKRFPVYPTSSPSSMTSMVTVIYLFVCVCVGRWKAPCYLAETLKTTRRRRYLSDCPSYYSSRIPSRRDDPVYPLL